MGPVLFQSKEKVNRKYATEGSVFEGMVYQMRRNGPGDHAQLEAQINECGRLTWLLIRWPARKNRAGE